ncbi:MmcQ/YjbR family DNA-binding protein [Nocardioides mesophilus]|uniref:MmcQ/YjbR family DNA-binding protein n=1 Tax=Nocardioides mesophilus TaxID=433659 RepID=A0A7G9RB82_9ACTN|nr:MmcQ/YjbR family DNA-binding protein [Nocardioides mesophilus]QNN52857.1 MmcQ/YjbR family DNA-binding protein [Nocardioides mesophilus]
MAGRARRARVSDVHEVALAMPHVSVYSERERPVYQVGGKSFVFFRSRRPDAFDPETGERYDDVIVFWVADEGDKSALVEDPASPFFTTPHFDGHPSVLLRASRIGELSRDEVAELVQDAWLSRASAKRARDWLASLEAGDRRFVSPADRTPPGPGAGPVPGRR